MSATEPLTHGHFERWRNEEFVPHIEAEERYERKVDKLDADLSMWLKMVSVIGGIVVCMGGATLGLFFWILIQKNNQIEDLQRETQRIAINQKGVMETLAIHTEELKRQATQDGLIMTQFIDHMRSQNAAMLELSKRSR
ncbi:MAG TPA: hypothetical protein VFP29_12495 [Methyloceanibacter sp.]|nr:hypothetical protein [Methyloceanibacter sp.]